MKGIAALLLTATVPSGAWAQHSDTSAPTCEASPGEIQPWANKSYTPECRAHLALAEFKTIDEKLRFLSPPPPKEKSAVRDMAKVLGLPTIGGSGGPAGLAHGAAATALPSPLTAAASYRFWDAHKQQPLFPFGYGLGYGDITMEGLGVADGSDGGKVVRVHLRNDGPRAASAVPEIYLGFPPAAQEPPKQLKGFAKVMLQPAEERDVAIPLPREAFRYWDVGKAAWAAGGAYEVILGRSSRDIVWHESVDVPPS